VLSQHHHHHNHKHNNNTKFSTFILEPQLSRQNWIHILEKITGRICNFLGSPSEGERSPPVCAWRISASSEHHSTIRTHTPSYYNNDNYNSSSSSSAFTRDLPHPPPPRPAPAPAQRTGSTHSQQWLRHRRPRRSARKHPLRLCTVHCTIPTSHIPHVAPSVAPRKAIPTPRLTLTARQRRTFNARPPHQPPARELALPTHIFHLRLRHQLHHSHNLSCTRHLGKHLLAAHWPTCSATPTTLHTANCQRHCLCFPLPARRQESATQRP